MHVLFSIFCLSTELAGKSADFSLVATRDKHRFFFVKRYIQFCDLYENGVKELRIQGFTEIWSKKLWIFEVTDF